MDGNFCSENISHVHVWFFLKTFQWATLPRIFLISFIILEQSSNRRKDVVVVCRTGLSTKYILCYFLLKRSAPFTFRLFCCDDYTRWWWTKHVLRQPRFVQCAIFMIYHHHHTIHIPIFSVSCVLLRNSFYTLLTS